MNTRTKSLLVPAVLVVVVLVFPRLVTSNYWLNLINLSISLAVACLGLNIVLGYAGQLSLAQAAFWGVGAYTSAILTHASWACPYGPACSPPSSWRLSSGCCWAFPP